MRLSVIVTVSRRSVTVMSVTLVRIFGGFTSLFGHVSAFVEESPNASICPTKSPPLNLGESFSLDIRYKKIDGRK